MIEQEDIDTLEFVHNRIIEVHDENMNVDYLIAFRKVLSKLSRLDGIQEAPNPARTESARSILWREVAASAARNGNSDYVTKFANKILEEYDAIFTTQEDEYA